MEGCGTDKPRRRSEGRRGSGLLLKAPEDKGEEDVLRESLTRLTGVTRAITANIRNINESLDRILMDSPEVEEMEKMLVELLACKKLRE